jgi:hypothetical protein
MNNIKRKMIVSTLEDAGYEWEDVNWWSDDALELEYERLTGEQPLTEGEEE